MRTIIAVVLFLCIIGSTSSVKAGGVKGKVSIPGESNLENVIVYLDGVKGTFPVPSKHAEMNHLNLQFVPHILAVMKGATVDFPNSDTVLHSAFSISKSNPFELGIYGQGHEKLMTFQNPGLVELFCHIHSHMHGYILVLENPFFGMTAKDGSYSIPNVPNGTYSLKAWLSPSDNIEKTVTISGNETLSEDFTLTAKR